MTLVGWPVVSLHKSEGETSPSPVPAGVRSVAAVRADARRTEYDFEAVFRSHRAKVTRTLRSLGIDSAYVDDAAQDVFVVVHAKLPEFEARAALSTWIYAVTLRVAQNYRRKIQRRAHSALSGTESDSRGDPAEHYAEGEAASFVQRFCEGLKEAKRDAFVLCVLEERPPAEVAEILGTNVDTLYSRVRSAREEFRRELRRFLMLKEVRK